MYTVGHGTAQAGEFAGLLRAHGVELIRDVRTTPKSRANPQYAIESIGLWLPASGIGYEWQRALGGRRRPLSESANGALRNLGFRGYADYMQTAPFAEALEDLIATAQATTTAIMCSESLWWKCHRRLVADALTARGIAVAHIMHNGKLTPHKLTEGAVIACGVVGYPMVN